MVGDTGYHVPQIGFGIEPVEFRRTDQAVDVGRAFPTSIRSSKQVVLASQGDAA